MSKKKKNTTKKKYNIPSIKSEAGEIEIPCAHTDIVPVVKVVPNPKNPNQHPEKQIKMLAQLIKAQGFRAPITISRRSNYVVRGHGRLKAAQLLGMESVPVDFQEYKDEHSEFADLVADNKIAELAEIDAEILQEIMEMLPEEAQALTAYEQELIQNLTQDDESAEAQLDSSINYQVIVNCKGEADQAELMAELEGRGYQVSPLMT